jgi:hypothetical protein
MRRRSMDAPPRRLYKKTSSELLADMRDLFSKNPEAQYWSVEQLALALDASEADVAACGEALLIESEMLA